MHNTIRTTLAALSSAILLAGCSADSSESSSSEAEARTVQGTVDGFGSVIVNGVHYVSSGAEFNIDDRAGVESDLRVGQVVTITGSDDGAEGTATRIVYDVGVEGPASSVDVAAGTFVVLGQAIITDAMTVFEGVTLETMMDGQGIEVSGYVDSNGQLHATYVAADDSGEAEVRGRIMALDEGAMTFEIRGQLVSYATVETLELDDGALTNGLLVEVEGAMDSGVLVASKIEQEDGHDFSSHDGLVKLYGYVTEVTDTTITIGENEILITASTEIEHGGTVDLTLNAFVKVEATVNEDGVLVATEIEFEAQVKVELEGPVTAVSENSVTVMGVTALVDTRTRIRDERDDINYFSLANLSAGDYVELRLAEQADGSFRALRLERDDAEARIKITAPVSSVDTAASSITMLGITVDMSAIVSINLSTLVTGGYLEVKGTFNGSVVTAIEVEDDDRYEDHDDEH
ncbi:DUF5666 domain-containing protein [uncultured Thalassolituus sp.]|jgi:hypothetical protein|uniref:DUF5666 domain-containing protein n=2 Tax=Thalassolituus sp. TaxID=2030822 RepID=UPI00260D92C5|nr:DUF5666 domain-containing protein [uncultured Thalassolituus sp.]